jgi:hypothetical protein
MQKCIAAISTSNAGSAVRKQNGYGVRTVTVMGQDRSPPVSLSAQRDTNAKMGLLTQLTASNAADHGQSGEAQTVCFIVPLN